MKLEEIGKLTKDMLVAWSEDDAPRLGAALAYYSLFSAGPLLLVITTIAGLAFGPQAAHGELFDHLTGIVGDTGASALQALVKAAYHPRTGLIASIIAAITVVLGAAGVIVQLKYSLDLIWRVKVKKGTGVRHFIKTYILSLLTIIAAGLLLTASLVLSTVVTIMGRFSHSWLPLSGQVLHLMSGGTSIVVLTALFGLMFKVLPDATVRWRDILPGAALTALLFEGGKQLIALYIGKAGISSSYGAAGSIIAILVWTYYSAQIFLLGAEFIAVYSRRQRPLKKRKAGLRSVAEQLPSEPTTPAPA